jgi:hypothetical protein
MMQPTDRLLSPSRGSPDEVFAWCKGYDRPIDDFLRDYVTAAYRLAPEIGLDASIVVAQSAHECFNPQTRKPWDSYWYRTRGNVAGLGITGTPSQDAASQTWTRGEDAAKAQMHHLGIYTGVDMLPWKVHNPRWEAAVDAGMFGVAKTINDLTGRWATDSAYAEKVAAKGNAIFPNLPDQGESMSNLTFGRVPHPEYQRNLITKPDGFGMNLLGPRKNYGVVYHRTIGRSIEGTEGWFRRNDVGALTQYGIGAPPPDAGPDGQIRMWADPTGPVSPWASGRVIAPWGDGPAFVRKFGANAVNQHLIAIEISGLYGDPISATTIEAVAAISAYWADQAEIPWDQYPRNPETGLTYTYWHQEFTGPDEKICPGPVVMNATDQIIARTKAILRTWQVTDDEPPVEPPPAEKHELPKGATDAWARRTFNPLRVKHPDDGKLIVFDRKHHAPSQVWLAYGKRHIPEGGTYEDGVWPALIQVVRRGDGSEDWQFATFIYNRKAA